MRDDDIADLSIEDLTETGAGWCLGTAGTFGCPSTAGSYGCLTSH
ncbi:hypothetical protein Ssi03_48900 [Sphaerisporangium siamense]|uniref:Thiocillin family RiPP n=1 Tax=Sphaerisporangium siamense TaxID=795645 RepID=A0A7W7G7S8_9ACTN|nr:hypothetical protein [Sphaerisporangium siamense]MBB4699487.1 hypothetical protein [Sphaerisporangium siamense]GII86900.1 hypothetical protein Ssi03_48900 [Sphaerisporangium siamense]